MTIYPTTYDQEGLPICCEMFHINPLMAFEGLNSTAANELIIMGFEKHLAI